jgi:phosphopantothenoylcysteine decarboxylase/phosphopantothenate--cysteine ligase
MEILITAGPTWAQIDKVRILTNRFTGKTGLYLANKLTETGHKVTLIVNPYSLGKVEGVKSYYFYYFDQFKYTITDLLKNNKFDAVVHMAAVSDYLPKLKGEGKISSGKKDFDISLVPAPKIIKIIRKLAQESILIQFKLEVEEKGIIDKAYDSLKKNDSDYVVANALESLEEGYQAQLIDKQKNIIKINSKDDLAKEINSLLAL